LYNATETNFHIKKVVNSSHLTDEDNYVDNDIAVVILVKLPCAIKEIRCYILSDLAL